jgi:hypothetical protein
MAVNQTISNFISAASQKDFARNNLFRIMGFKTRVLTLDESELIYCKGATLPARTTPTTTVSYHGMKMNYNQSTVDYTGSDNYQLKFYLDADGDLRKRFEEASRIIFNDVSNTGNWRFPSTDDVVTIAQLGFDLEPIKFFKLHGVTIKSIEGIDTQIADGDGSAIEVTITLSYLYYKTEGSDISYTE